LVLVLALVRREDADVVDAATAFATLCSKWASGVDGRRALSTEAAISFVLALAVSPVVAALAGLSWLSVVLWRGPRLRACRESVEVLGRRVGEPAGPVGGPRKHGAPYRAVCERARARGQAAASAATQRSLVSSPRTSTTYCVARQNMTQERERRRRERERERERESI